MIVCYKLMIKENKGEVLNFSDYYRFDTFLNFNNSKIRLNKWKKY
jgi:hypothetical protein